MTALAGFKGDVYIASGTPVAFTDTVLTDSGDHKTYYDPTASHRYWDLNTALVVEHGNPSYHTEPVANYTVQYAGGKIVCSSANGATDTIRVDGAYLPYSKLAEGREWNLNFQEDLFETTVFNPTVPWKTYVPMFRGGSISISHWWVDDTLLASLTAATPMIVVLHVDQASDVRYEGYAVLTQESVRAAVGGMVEQPLSFNIYREFYFRNGNA